MAEDRKEPPFEGGSQPVSHQPDPLPGAASGAGRIVALVVAVLVLAAAVVYVLGRL